MSKITALLILMLILIILGIFYLINNFIYYANTKAKYNQDNPVAETTAADYYRDKISDLNLVIIATTIPNNQVA